MFYVGVNKNCSMKKCLNFTFLLLNLTLMHACPVNSIIFEKIVNYQQVSGKREINKFFTRARI